MFFIDFKNTFYSILNRLLNFLSFLYVKAFWYSSTVTSTATSITTNTDLPTSTLPSTSTDTTNYLKSKYIFIICETTDY